MVFLLPEINICKFEHCPLLFGKTSVFLHKDLTLLNLVSVKIKSHKNNISFLIDKSVHKLIKQIFSLFGKRSISFHDFHCGDPVTVRVVWLQFRFMAAESRRGPGKELFPFHLQTAEAWVSIKYWE